MQALMIFLQKAIWQLSKHWLPLALLVAAAILGLALLAPALMADGFTGEGQTVYRWLAPHDHQLPHRSYFLFGQNGLVQSYSLEQVLARGADPNNLRAFVGNPDIGYKMGLNHRMTAIFIGIFFGGVFWALAGERPQVGPFWFILFLLPLLLDGFSHLASEDSGAGFRDTNDWAVTLTGGLLSNQFYQGATIGSLNWLLRTLTGLLFGVGFVWFLFTYLSYRFGKIRMQLAPKLRKRGRLG